MGALKKQVKEMKQENREKEEEIGSLRRNIKTTKILEMEIEIKMYADECTRLKHMLEEVMKQGEMG